VYRNTLVKEDDRELTRSRFHRSWLFSVDKPQSSLVPSPTKKNEKKNVKGEGDGVLFGDWLFAGFVVAFLEVVSVVFWVGVLFVIGGCFSWKWLRNGSLVIL